MSQFKTKIQKQQQGKVNPNMSTNAINCNQVLHKHYDLLTLQELHKTKLCWETFMLENSIQLVKTILFKIC